MANRMIYLSHELNEQLAKEENASALISKLITDYYRLNTFKIEEIEVKQNKLEEERKKLNEKYSEEYAILENRKKMIQKKEEEELERKEYERRKREEKILNICANFSEEMGREMTKEELSSYLLRLENEKGFNFFKFIDELKERMIESDKSENLRYNL